MVDLWMPGAQKHSVGNTGAMNGGPARATWHITSNSKDWSFKNELGWFSGGGADVAPHLLWDPFTGEIAQFFPADSRSLSLMNDGAVKTNRTGKYNIQIEIVFTQGETVGGKKYNSVAETPLKGLDQIMDWLHTLGIADTWPGGVPTAFVRDTVSETTWQTKGGHYGHNQIPGNSHVDPGPMPDIFSYGTDTPTSATSYTVKSGDTLWSIGVKFKVSVDNLKSWNSLKSDEIHPGDVLKLKDSVVKKPTTPKYEPFPGAALFQRGNTDKRIAAMHKRLVAVGCNHYQSDRNSDVWGSGDVASYAAWQRKCGYTGSAADGVPGKTSWDKLKVPNV